MHDGCGVLNVHPRIRVGTPMSFTLYISASTFLNSSVQGSYFADIRKSSILTAMSSSPVDL